MGIVLFLIFENNNNTFTFALMIDLSITTSQRIDLFVQSITSLRERTQYFQPKTIYHYDDSSCEEERAEMQYLLRHLFKPKKMVSRFYEKKTSKMVIDIAESCRTGNTTWVAQIPNMFFIPKTIGYLSKT